MRITHAQPLVPTSDDELQASPLLSPAEAEVEAFVLGRCTSSFTLDALRDGPATFLYPLGSPLEGELAFYTHRLHMMAAPDHICRDYLVRVE